MEKHLHIISFTVPFPADYGGMYDVFYKLPALHALGIQIHLHCFDYGRGEQSELNKYCTSVKYYERQQGHKGISNSLPYIVASRKNEELLQNLLQDDYPVLMEGVHCTYLLLDKRFDNRKCFVRLHNVEYQYYRDLFLSTSSPLKKLYYWRESKLLWEYEKKIADKAFFWSVTEKDNEMYRQEFKCTRIAHLSLHLPDWKVEGPEGLGNYCLYHGDLSITANEKAVSELLEKVFAGLDVHFVIAGRNPSKKLALLVQHSTHTCLVANPTEKEMQDMIAKAHINILPSCTHTGIKLKLVNALYHGRHCVVNDATVAGSGLEAACHTGANHQALKNIIIQLYHQPFTTEDISLRKRLLSGLFNNRHNAIKMMKTIWG
ncbi:MAG: hypothetical protein NVSMB63_05250 [Sediminibacterium sp.]